MLANPSDYIFTNGAAQNLIHGGYSKNAVAFSHEHWLWMNECVRTLKFAGSFKLNQWYAQFTEGTAKNSPLCMAPKRSVLDGWRADVDAVLTARRPIIPTAVWYQSKETERSDDINAPEITDAQIEAFLSYSTRPPIEYPESMAPKLSLFTSMFGTSGATVNYYCYGTTWYRAWWYGGLYAKEPGAQIGAFGNFYHQYNSKWKRNGSDSTKPEADADLALSPFLWRHNQEDYLRAETFFREVTDQHDFTYAQEMDLTYTTPREPWANSESRQEYLIQPIWACCVVPLWKDDRDTYSYDEKRSWFFLSHFDIMPGGNVKSGQEIQIHLDASTISQYYEGIKVNARNRGFDPENIPGTRPRWEASGSGWRKVGYQLYFYPTAIMATAACAGRNMGE